MRDDALHLGENIIEHVTPADGNIFLDLGFPPEEAENLRIRCDLMMEITEIIRGRRLKQKKAAELFGVSQPRISDVTRRKIDEFTIDSLVNMLAHAGLRVDVSIRAADAEAGAPGEAARPPARTAAVAAG